MKLDQLEYLPLLIPSVCRSSPVYEMARIHLKAIFASYKLYAVAFHVLGGGKILTGIIHQQEIGDVLYIRRINLSYDEEGNEVSRTTPVETMRRISLEDILEYVPLQPKV